MKEKLLNLIDSKIEECYSVYRKVLSSEQVNLKTLEAIEKLINNLSTKKVLFEALELSKEETEEYIKDIDSLNIKMMFL